MISLAYPLNINLEKRLLTREEEQRYGKRLYEIKQEASRISEKYLGENHLSSYKKFSDAVSKLEKILSGKEKEELENLTQELKEIIGIFVIHNEGLVIKIARNKFKRGRGGYSGLDDLISLGRIGIMEAAYRFDYTKRIKFSTYAWRGILLKIISNLSHRILSMSRYKMSQTRKILYELKKSQDIDMKKISRKTGINKNDVKNILLFLEKKYIHIDDYKEESKMKFEIPFKENKEESRDFQEILRKIKEKLKTLKEKERYVIEQRFGLEDGEIKTLLEIGNRLGVSKQRVGQIEEKALEKLRKVMVGEGY